MGCDDLFAVVQVQGDPVPPVGIERLDDDGEAQFRRSRPGVLGVGDLPSRGDGHADLPQHRLGQLLVGGDREGDGAGPMSLGGGEGPLPRPLPDDAKAFVRAG